MQRYHCVQVYRTNEIYYVERYTLKTTGVPKPVSASSAVWLTPRPWAGGTPVFPEGISITTSDTSDMLKMLKSNFQALLSPQSGQEGVQYCERSVQVGVDETNAQAHEFVCALGFCLPCQCRASVAFSLLTRIRMRMWCRKGYL